MTNIGYDYISKMVKEREVFPPKGLTTEQLTFWLNGYSTCLNDVLRLLEALKNDNERS